jgi:chromosome segregation ATPase
MATGNKTTAQQLQECKDTLAQKNNDIERTAGLMEELESVRAKLAEAEDRLEQDVSVSTAERRAYREQIAAAEAAALSWTRRGTRAEQIVRDQAALINEIKSLVEGKECLLPQIARLLG